MKLKLTNVEYGTITKYFADIEIDGMVVGYVQKTRNDERYLAFAGGLRIASERTITDVKEAIREHFESERRSEPKSK